MANRLRGEIDWAVKAGTYRLRFATHEICEVENLLGLGINQIIALLRDPDTVRVATWQALLWGCLRRRHPKMTLLDVSDLIDEVGLAEARNKVIEAMNAANPDPEEGGAENPQVQATA